MDINALKAKQIKLVILDVDGVLTNGQLIYTHSGESIKIFNVKDGLGIKLLQQIGIKVAILSSRISIMVEWRMDELDVDFVLQDYRNKLLGYDTLVKELELKDENIAYMGDDLPDLALIKKSGFGVAVADAHPVVKAAADWITVNKGGMGAVRELSDFIIKAQDRELEILESFL